MKSKYILDISCPENYKEVLGVTNTTTGCFFLSDETSTRHTAKTKCEETNGYLAMLNDEATFLAVTTSPELSFQSIG